MRCAVIVSTYNSHEWLEKVVWGYAAQTDTDLELIVADDGSTDETRALLDELRREAPFPIQHVWHEDQGFRKCAILNRAIAETQAEYLIFSDGDCVPRRDFVATHLRLREPGRFLSGGYFKLPLELSRALTREDIQAGRATDPTWLRSQGIKRGFKYLKVAARGPLAEVLNAITPTKVTWNGHNSSGWRADIVAVNGLDERMGYWAEDRELGERLMNAGIRPKQIRYNTTCLHLDHERPYKDPQVKSHNMNIRRETRARRAVWTDYGIVKRSQTSQLDS